MYLILKKWIYFIHILNYWIIFLDAKTCYLKWLIIFSMNKINTKTEDTIFFNLLFSWKKDRLISNILIVILLLKMLLGLYESHSKLYTAKILYPLRQKYNFGKQGERFICAASLTHKKFSWNAHLEFRM